MQYQIKIVSGVRPRAKAYRVLCRQVFPTINGSADHDEVLASAFRTRRFKYDAGHVVDIFICRKFKTALQEGSAREGETPEELSSHPSSVLHRSSYISSRVEQSHRGSAMFGAAR